MKIDFLIPYLQQAIALEKKVELLEAVKEADWIFDSPIHEVNKEGHFTKCIDLVIYSEESNFSGFWLSNIPIDLFPKEFLIQELTKLQLEQ